MKEKANHPVDCWPTLAEVNRGIVTTARKISPTRALATSFTLAFATNETARNQDLRSHVRSDPNGQADAEIGFTTARIGAPARRRRKGFAEPALIAANTACPPRPGAERGAAGRPISERGRYNFPPPRVRQGVNADVQTKGYSR
ncbi:MAG: hypothetical protein HZT41_14170 [Dechloromonas sp.]|nr:MAG: hypothetical protein HZT41_14170 [Dechloromonas sp.]